MKQFETLRMVNPQTGSRTAILEAAQERAEEAAGDVGALAASATAGDATPLVGRVLQRLREPWNPRVADEVATLLTRGDLTAADLERIMSRGDIPEATRRRLRDMLETVGQTTTRQFAGRTGAAENRPRLAAQ